MRKQLFSGKPAKKIGSDNIRTATTQKSAEIAAVLISAFYLRFFASKTLRYVDSSVSIVPAATAVPMTPATFGPIACMSRKLEGYSLWHIR